MSPKSILLIGGSPSYQMLMSEAFGEYDVGANVSRIDTVEEAFSYLKIKSERKDAPPPHAIIINEKMTKLGGCVLLKFIKENPWLVGVPHFVMMPRVMIRLTDCMEEITTCHVEEPNTWQEFEILVKVICEIISTVWNDSSLCKPVAIVPDPLS